MLFYIYSQKLKMQCTCFCHNYREQLSEFTFTARVCYYLASYAFASFLYWPEWSSPHFITTILIYKFAHTAAYSSLMLAVS